ncbi:protein indeterminate-domain 12-like [Magnolia sinica]|uniref:protein indeterminate-domain 12-like n=1 Tax=Magnolia sinica TaxID=86752 RepID=UPI00265886BB|nr:protein indeterminate-domain 12-like [Magnolia sinica]XP_058085521.1 protein indeterminate-domain 12-like [Magnolia sinica]
MLHATMSNSTSLSEEASVSSGIRIQDFNSLNSIFSAFSPQEEQKIKKKRSLPGNPDPDSEVIALSPKTLMATNRFVCEICNKGFQRDQNLQLHRRGHNLPWKLRQRSSKEIRKRVYVCPEPSCIHHHPSRALGDLTGIKKHFCRKHGEKKWKCEKCSKRYAVQSDWKAHSKTCGTREYRCDCGTLFSRKDSFVTHRAFCDALAEESARLSGTTHLTDTPLLQVPQTTISPCLFPTHTTPPTTPPANTPLSVSWFPPQNSIPTVPIIIKPETHLPTFHNTTPLPPFFQETSHKQPQPLATSSSYHRSHLTNPTCQMLSASTNCMQGAAADVQGHMDAVGHMIPPGYMGIGPGNLSTWQKRDQMTRDFLGLAGEAAAAAGVNVRDLLSFTGVDFNYDRDHTLTWGDC